MADGEQAVQQALERVRRQVLGSRKRIAEFFRDFDKLNTKRVQPSQVARALSSSGLRLSPDDISSLTARFSTPDGAFFLYGDFCDAVDEVFTTKGLETQPHYQPQPALLTGTRASQLGAVQLSEAERAALQPVLDRCRAAVRSRGIIVKDFFRDFDKLNTGFVTDSQFRREVAKCFSGVSINDAEAALLAKAFSHVDVDGDGHARVCYRQLHDAVEDPRYRNEYAVAAAAAAAVATRRPRSQSPSRSIAAAALSPSAATTASSAFGGGEAALVIASLIRQASERRVRLAEFFVDYDPLRTGLCTQGQMQRALHAAGIQITEEQAAALAGRFTEVASGKVRFNELLAAVEQAFTVPGLEKQPTVQADTVPAKLIARERRVCGASDLRPEEATRASEVLAAVAAEIGRRRIQLKDKFQDFDSRRTMTVTRARFERVLALTGLLPGTCFPLESDVRSVERAFQVPDREDMVHYAEFLRVVAPEQAPQSSVVTSAPLDLTLSTAALARSQQATPATQLGSAAAPAAAGMRSSTALRVAGTAAASATGSAPSTRSGRPTTRSRSSSPLGGPATAARASVPDLLSRARQYALSNGVRCDDHFRDRDKLRHGIVTAAQFVQGVLAAIPVLSKADAEVLANHYVSHKAVDAAGAPMVNWRAFDDDVSAVFTRKGLESAPLDDVDSLVRASIADGVVQPPPRLTDSESELLRDLLRTVEQELRTRRILAAPAFQDFDRLHRGCVPSPQFRRALVVLGLGPLLRSHKSSSYGGVSDGDGAFALLEKAFRMPAADRLEVNYRWFLAAADSPELIHRLPGDDDYAAATVEATRTLRGGALLSAAAADKVLGQSAAASHTLRSRVVAARPDAVDGEALLRKMREQAITRGIRVKEFLVDYDKLRTGTITKPKFRTAIAAAGFTLTADEIAWLERELSLMGDAASDSVEWRGFVTRIDGGGDQVEKAPTRKFERDVVPRPTDLVSLDSVDSAVLQTLHDKIRSTVRMRSIMAKPYFEARDSSKRGFVTPAQFTAVLDFLKIAQLCSQAEIDTLLAAYAIPGQAGRVNYVKFCTSIDPSQLQ